MSLTGVIHHVQHHSLAFSFSILTVFCCFVLSPNTKYMIFTVRIKYQYNISCQSTQQMSKYLNQNQRCKPHSDLQFKRITTVSRIHPLVTINVISSFMEILPVVEGKNLADSLSSVFRFRNSSSRKHFRNSVQTILEHTF